MLPHDTPMRLSGEQKQALAARMLADMLQHGGKFCPASTIRRSGELEFLNIARTNKVEHLLLHCGECQTCKTMLSRRFFRELEIVKKRNIVSRLLYQVEKNNLLSLMKRRSLKCIFYKEEAAYLTHAFDLDQRSRADLDVLVSPGAAKQLVAYLTASGYKRKVLAPKKEITLIHPRTGFELDVHHLLAYPHYGGLRDDELATVERFTQDFLSLEKNDRRLYMSNPEYVLLSMIMCIWFNDLLTGLRSLYDIFQACRSGKIGWTRFFSLAKKYDFHNESLFVITIAHRIYDRDVSSEIANETPLFSRIFAYTVQKIHVSVFPPITGWDKRKYKDKARPVYRRFFALKHCLETHKSIFRFLRPRIAFLFINALFSYTRLRISQKKRF